MDKVLPPVKMVIWKSFRSNFSPLAPSQNHLSVLMQVARLHLRGLRQRSGQLEARKKAYLAAKLRMLRLLVMTLLIIWAWAFSLNGSIPSHLSFN